MPYLDPRTLDPDLVTRQGEKVIYCKETYRQKEVKIFTIFRDCLTAINSILKSLPNNCYKGLLLIIYRSSNFVMKSHRNLVGMHYAQTESFRNFIEFCNFMNFLFKLGASGASSDRDFTSVGGPLTFFHIILDFIF